MATSFHRYDVEGWGAGELWLRDGRIVVHELVPAQRTTSSQGEVPLGGESPPEVTVPRPPERESAAFVSNLCERFRAHLGGARTTYDDLRLDLDGLTGLQASMARALRRVPWGEVVTYGELAALAGRPGAARAAGAFCAEGRWALIVPCHRVVAAGGIGGYGPSGVALKRRLLRLEGVEL